MKHGFTLAELLITLAIIGVVAALTLPSILKNIQVNTSAPQIQSTYCECK